MTAVTKRLLALLCALTLLLSLAACGEGKEEEKKDDTSSVPEEVTPEEVFDKAFEADKNYDIDAMAEVEYSINFGKSIDKTERVAKMKESIEQLDQDKLAQYKEQLKDASYTIVDKTALTEEEMKSRIAQLEPQYKDTDKITGIIKMTYEVDLGGSTGEPRQDAVEMIRVGDTWYCYMGEQTRGS